MAEYPAASRPALPLVHLAQRRLDAIARICDGAAAFPDACTLLLERARLNGLTIPGMVSAGGGCHLYRSSDGWIALNLARDDDASLIPALVGRHEVADLGKALSLLPSALILEQGRTLGLAIAALDEKPVSPPIHCTSGEQGGSSRPRSKRLQVLDLSALWAGPLASRLLQMAGCEVTRIESKGRRDPLRESDPAHFAALNAGKQSIEIDLRTNGGRDELLSRIRTCDIVIEAARPRALLQLGIDPDAIVQRQAGLAWITITGHGVCGQGAHWIGFGDDTAICGGLSRELHRVSGRYGFVGDAIGDPITGIAAALCALQLVSQGAGGRCILAMSALVAEAIDAERRSDPGAWDRALQSWADQTGKPIAAIYCGQGGDARC